MSSRRPDGIFTVTAGAVPVRFRVPRGRLWSLRSSGPLTITYEMIGGGPQLTEVGVTTIDLGVCPADYLSVSAAGNATIAIAFHETGP